MLADADLAALGRTLGDTHRARFVLALLGGPAFLAYAVIIRLVVLAAGLLWSRRRERRIIWAKLTGATGAASRRPWLFRIVPTGSVTQALARAAASSPVRPSSLAKAIGFM